MSFIQLLSSSFVVLSITFSISQAFSQETQSANSPIYLEEPEPEPAARVARRRTLKKAYEDESPRTERSVVQLSDDRIVNDGKYIEYYRGGQKYVEGTYKMGVFEGDWSYWFPNGQLRKTVSFKNSKPEGQWEEYDEEGTRVAQKSYRAGKRHGQWLTYFEDGAQPKVKLTYEKNLIVGERFSYFKNGQKRQSIHFKDGIMDGLMTVWDINGKKTAEATFKAGKLVKKNTQLEVE